MGAKKRKTDAGAKIGRPRIDPASTASFQVSVRFPDAVGEDFQRLLYAINEEMRAQGLPMVNLAALVRAWLEQRLAEELRKRRLA